MKQKKENGENYPESQNNCDLAIILQCSPKWIIEESGARCYINRYFHLCVTLSDFYYKIQVLLCKRMGVISGQVGLRYRA